MYEMTDALAADTELANRYALAHENYLAERERIRLISGTDEVPEIENISAGGMPTRVKCLHAVIGHTLAVGRGINLWGTGVWMRSPIGGPRRFAHVNHHGGMPNFSHF